MKNYYICPYCFERNKVSEVAFQCSNTEKDTSGNFVCAWETDDVKTKFLRSPNEVKGRKIIMPKTGFLSQFSMPTKAICPACMKETRDRVCTKCHSRLPDDIDETEDMFFSVIGAKNAGKSHYLTVLINIISEVLTRSFPFCISPADDDTSSRYRNEFKAKIYENKTTIEATHSRNNVYEAKPLIYYIKFYKSGAKGKKPIKTITVAFFDTAGEELDAEDTMLNINRYIFNSSGIIFLLDPLQLTGVREKLLATGRVTLEDLPSVNTEMETIISRTTRLIRKANDLKANDKIKIPIAVAFSKIDVLTPILDKSSYLLMNSRHVDYGRFDIDDCENIKMEIEAILSNWAGNDLLQQVSVNFENYSYFGLSALGCNPQATRVIDNVVPHRVEDPFLWLLWTHKLIEGTK